MIERCYNIFMLKDPKAFDEWEKRWKREEGPLPIEKALTIVEALWEEGRQLGKLPPSDPLEGIETDIRVARIINACLKSSSKK